MTSGPTYRDGRYGSGTWRNPWFDQASQYIPSSYKEMFRWCYYLYSTSSVVAPIINKKGAYVTTELIYAADPNRPNAQKSWKEILEKRMRIREFELKLNLDYDVYGNAFASIYFPFERYLQCKNCKEVSVARQVEWKYEQFTFRGRCPKCKASTSFSAEDRTIRNGSRIRLIKWNPQYIDIRHNPITDSSEYIYRIPKYLRKSIANYKINRHLVAETPIDILEAIKQKKNFLLDQDNVYHMRTPSPSGEDEAFGMPPLMPVFKDLWLLQVYRQAQEAVALDHVLPMTLLSPSTTASGLSPHQSTDLSDWSRRTLETVHRWRRDQNSIFTVPYPVNAQNIRGDAGALNVFNEISQITQRVAGGLDVPQEFIYGGLSWSGSSVSLRVLENLFLARTEQLNCFLTDFVVPKVRSFLSLPKIEIRHRDFKMADDAQQKQLAMSLRQTNTISDQTTIEELGFDSEREETRKRAEAIRRDQDMVARAKASAEAQAIAIEIQTAAQIRSQQQQQQGLGAQVKTGSDRARGLWRLPEMPELTDIKVQQFIKGPGSPDDKRFELAVIQRDDPTLFRAIQEYMARIKQQASDPYMKPLPEARPPRRANSPI